MNFVLPIRPSRPSRGPKTPKPIRTTKTLQPPPESPRRRPSLAARAGVVKRRSSVSTTFNAPSMSFFEAIFGDDFPDTFAHDDGRSCKSKRTLFELPAEVLEIMCQSLSKMDIKRLRLANTHLARAVDLRIDRVFVSPNRANLDCLNSILNNDRYRLQVQEIVWDDAQLDEYPVLDLFQERLISDQEKARVALEDHLSTLFQDRDDHDADYDSIGVENCIEEDGSLTHLGKIILLNSEDQKSRDIIASHAASMSIEDSYALYEKLYQDEREIIKRGWDVAGLQRALTHFSNLRRITITSEVWRPWFPVPVYDTPFYRALPPGFRKPSVWPWIGSSHLGSVASCIHDVPTRHLPAKWRGYSIVMASLARNPVPSLQEFALDTGQESIGLPHEFFPLPKIDYANTIQALSTAPITKLQLSFSEHIAAHRGRNITARASTDFCVLQHVISTLPLLEHLDLKWTVLPLQAYAPFPNGFLQQYCPNLKVLALRYAKLTESWLYNSIIDLKSLEIVILDKIVLDVPEAHTATLCADIFSSLRDHYATTSLRGPKFTWINCLPDDPTTDWMTRTCKQWIVVDDELNSFLYDSGDSPWNVGHSSVQPQMLKDTAGWVMDGRDPSFRKRRSEVLKGQRNPWPIDGAMSDTPRDWRIY
ncbi:hypothetical protein SVAN01_08201 [Stagonosporopsis vannaccii]|nr:hypothetical protein SVAN01_08201 [Stagonosporopsis vannaccii]